MDPTDRAALMRRLKDAKALKKQLQRRVHELKLENERLDAEADEIREQIAEIERGPTWPKGEGGCG